MAELLDDKKLTDWTKEPTVNDLKKNIDDNAKMTRSRDYELRPI